MVRSPANTKTGVEHTIYLNNQTAEMFRELQVLAGDSRFVLPGKSSINGPMHANTLNGVLDRISLTSSFRNSRFPENCFDYFAQQRLCGGLDRVLVGTSDPWHARRLQRRTICDRSQTYARMVEGLYRHNSRQRQGGHR